MASNCGIIYTLAVQSGEGLNGILRVGARRPLKLPLTEFDPVILSYTTDQEGQIQTSELQSSAKYQQRQYQRMFVDIILERLRTSAFFRELEKRSRQSLRGARLHPELRDFLSEQLSEYFLFGTAIYPVGSDELEWNSRSVIVGGGGGNGRRIGSFKYDGSNNSSWGNVVKAIER